MTGYRVGWACGNSHFVKTLLKVKTNIDSGIFGSVQDAAIHALRNESKYVQQLRKTIRERRDVFVDGLKLKGFNKVYADSTFYVWVKLPRPYTSSIDFAKHLLQKKVVATPGLGFGKWGEGYIRFAMTVDKKLLKKVIEII
jgi:LL-diaminopimelate aminotransferase